MGVVVAAAALLVAAAGCGSSSRAVGAGSGRPQPATASAAGTAGHSGSVEVLSAGALQDLMQRAVGPGFHAATGYTELDVSAGSTDLAAEIRGRVRQGDVFLSASPKVDASLQGAAGGGWVSWYATFAGSDLVLGYARGSRFAAALRTQPWYEVVTRPGFRLGFTPPASDPKGVLAVRALDATAAARHLPALRTIAARGSDQYPETALAAEVESGQLDAGFFYRAEANSVGLPTVALTGVELRARFTVTVLARAPHPAAALAFVAYLLGPAGRAELARFGFDQVAPAEVSGSGVPAALRPLLGAGTAPAQ